MIDWNKYFNHIFILSGCSNFLKREQLDNEFKRIGLNNYTYWYNCQNNLINKDHFNINNSSEQRIKNNHQQTTIGHYSLIKTYYELGYENLLICEDDIRFLKDINEIENQLNIFLENKDKIDIYYFDYFVLNNMIYNFDCIYINRKAMEYFIYCVENFPLVIDNYITTKFLFYNNYLSLFYHYGFFVEDDINNVYQNVLYPVDIPLEKNLLPIQVMLSPKKICIENDINKHWDNIDKDKYNINFI